MQSFTLSDGGQIYYKDTGGDNKPVLLMLHGWTSSHEVYDRPVEFLQDDIRCITYDHRGHGMSIEAGGRHITMETLADDLHELLEGLCLSDVTLLGWSMGAGVVMTYTERYGCDRLRHVILCDMPPKQLNDNRWMLGLYRGSYTKDTMERDQKKDFLSLYCDFAVGTIPRLKRVPRPLLKRLLKHRLKSCDETSLCALSASMKAQDHRASVSRISVPLTYFYPDPGSIFSPELVYWYTIHATSHFTSVRFGDSTHMLIMEHPREFAYEVRRVMEK